MDRQLWNSRGLLRYLAYNAIAVIGGLALLRLTPGPAAIAIAAGVAYVAAVWIAASFIDRRWPSGD